MKKVFLLLVMMVFGVSLHAELSTGDVAFVGFNADGNDDIAFVAFAEIPANTTIYLCDSEWNGSAFGDDENDVVWNSGENAIPQGTVITINNLDDAITTNQGSVTGGTGLSKSGEAVFAYLGTDLRMPTTFLGAIANQGNAFGILDNTGLQSGLTAIVLTETADIAFYNGPRTGLGKGGYMANLNNMDNWLIQDTDGDDQNDGTAPDLPFDTTPFVISDNDLTAPFVTMLNVEGEYVITVYFSEEVINAETAENYEFMPSINIQSVVFDNSTNTASITHDGLATGIAYTLSVSDIEDVAGNTMSETWISESFFYNPTNPQLMITEIMYNPPSDNSDNLEFLEIYNAGATIVNLGGISVKDEGNFNFVFPEMQLQAGEIVLLATDADFAGSFYSETFLDMVPNEGNTLGNGGELIQILNSEGDVIFETEYDDKAPWATEADGDGPSLELLNMMTDPLDGNSWVASSNFVGKSLGEDVFASPGTFTQVYNSQIAFADEYIKVNENDNNAEVTVMLSSATNVDVSFDVTLLQGIGTAVESADFNFSDMQYTIPSGSTYVNISIPLIDNFEPQSDRFFALAISNVFNASTGSVDKSVVFIIDNDKTYPMASEELEIEFVSSYLVDAGGSAEIVDYDPESKRLFVLNSTATKVEILDFSDPANISKINTVDMTQYGEGATSIAVKNGVVAASVVGENFEDGELVLMDIDGNIINAVMVGNLPDMVTFTPDGNFVMTANEGQPNDEYTIDPEGSVSMIDISGGIENLTQSDVTTISFASFNPFIDELIDSGIRIFGHNANVAQDMEPEYITVSEDSQTAWVSCQENNAIVIIDIPTKTVTDILPLGTKDHSIAENSFDQSDKTDFVFMGNWNVKGMYLPDAIANYTVNGNSYIITANEGDQREYDHIDEDVSVGDGSYVLDPEKYPHADLLKKEFMLGRLAVSPYDGDTDGDGDIDEIHSFGSRSFSIWNSLTGELVYDSKNDFEMITANDPNFGAIFNASNSNNNFKNRSDNKGPEPEGVTVAKIKDKVYAFITLERVGGVMTYNVTDPQNPVFVNYSNSRTVESEGGDLGPEGIIYIRPEDSPIASGLVVVANEVSATISVYSINNDMAPFEINVSNIDVCRGATTELGLLDDNDNVITVTGGSRNYQYSWSPANKVDDPASGNPVYGPVYNGTTSFTLTVKDIETDEQISKNITVNTLQQPNLFLPSVKILRTSDFGINCYNLNDLASGNFVSRNWYDADMNQIEDPTCMDFSASGLVRVYAEGINEAGCSSMMKRMIVFTANGKQTVEENNITVSDDGSALIYATPNPVIDNANVFANFDEVGNIIVTVYDMRGTAVLQFEKHNTNTIDENIKLGNLNSGVYFIRVTDGKSEVSTKIVKQ